MRRAPPSRRRSRARELGRQPEREVLMPTPTEAMDVRRVSDAASVVEIKGNITALSEPALMDAYTRASGDRTRAILLNFRGLEYMNSGGIGLLVALLVRADRQKPRLRAFGLNA